MTADRELLELAAKAAGIDVEFWPLSGANIVSGPHAGLWRPLEDDGDAFRLAVQCKLDIKHHEDCVVAWWDNYFGTGRIDYDGDPCAATRRAIVLAAAEIGKQGGDKP